jgi:hypothetical protein
MAAKSNVSKLFPAGKASRQACAACEHLYGHLAARECGVRPCAFTIDEFELGEAQKIAVMVEPLAGGLGGDLVIFA